jgi:hypothetical protein
MALMNKSLTRLESFSNVLKLAFLFYYKKQKRLNISILKTINSIGLILETVLANKVFI